MVGRPGANVARQRLHLGTASRLRLDAVGKIGPDMLMGWLASATAAPRSCGARFDPPAKSIGMLPGLMRWPIGSLCQLHWLPPAVPKQLKDHHDADKAELEHRRDHCLLPG